MSPVSILKTKVFCAKVIDLASHLEADNERLRQAAVELSHETAALRQKSKKVEADQSPGQEVATPPAKDR